jgi:tetratricopeptide (TPR) repeat protein
MSVLNKSVFALTFMFLISLAVSCNEKSVDATPTPGSIENLKSEVLKFEKTPGDNNKDLIRCLRHLGLSYKNDKQYLNSKITFVRAIELMEKSQGLKDAGFLPSLQQVIELSLNRGSNEDAEKFMRKMVALLEGASDDSVEALVEALEVLSGFYMMKHSDNPDYEKKISLYIKQVADLRDCNPTIDDSWRVAQKMLTQGLPATCEIFLFYHLKAAEKRNGIDSPNIVYALVNLAKCYEKTQQPQKAEALFRRCADIEANLTKTPGKVDAEDITEVANGCLRLKEYEKAERLYETALKLREDSLGLNAVPTLWSVSNLSRCYEEWGKPEKAEAVYLQALSKQEKQWAIDSVELVPLLNDFGRYYQYKPQAEKGEQYLVRALNITRKTYGPNHIKVAQSLKRLGEYYTYGSQLTNDREGWFTDVRNSSVIDKGIKCFKEALEIHKAVVSGYEKNEDRNLANALDDLGSAYDNVGIIYSSARRPEESKEFLNKGAQCRRQAGALRREAATQRTFK